MKHARSKMEMSHGEIEEAMKFFFARGGKVTRFSEQKVSSITVIGAEKWGVYEALGDLRF